MTRTINSYMVGYHTNGSGRQHTAVLDLDITDLAPEEKNGGGLLRAITVACAQAHNKQTGLITDPRSIIISLPLLLNQWAIETETP